MSFFPEDSDDARARLIPESFPRNKNKQSYHNENKTM